MSTAAQVLNRLAKWRLVLAGWQLGTRPLGDPESDAVRDHREATLLLRAEVTALTALLIEKGIFSEEEFGRQVAAEAEHHERELEKRFPGARATADGITIDIAQAAPWMRNFRP